MKVLFASSNEHKLLELKKLFEGSSFGFILADEKLDVVEDGDTYFENSLLKAKAYYEKYKMPVVSDDSGLTIEAFPNLLGIHSARFAPELKEQALKNDKLLEILQDEKNRRAFFTAVLCFYFGEDEIFFFEGILKGEIAKTSSGNKGFGYDPIFIGEGRDKSLADDFEWKNLNSHRAKAAQMALEFFKTQGSK